MAPRVLQDLRGGHTRCTLLGREWPMPLLVAPMAYQRWAHHHGESGMAMAAAAQSCGMVLSHQTSTPLQDVASTFLQDQDPGPLWFQMYWQSDRSRVQALLSDVEDAGYQAIVLTVDAPVHGVRDRERRHGMPLPEGVRAVHWPEPTAAHTNTQSQGFEKVGAAPDASVHQHQGVLALLAHRLHHTGQQLGGGGQGVQYAPTVIADDHACRADLQRLTGVLCLGDAFEQHG